MQQENAYQQAGVDVHAGYETVRKITPMLERTYTPGVLGTVGGFGGLFAPDFSGMERPVLISGADGVGTKLRYAFILDKHDTVGSDVVSMCVNDILCAGAKPLFFLDYLSMGKNYPDRSASIVQGVSDGCVQSGAALIGGETAEMPGFYSDDEYDLAGFAVGMVDEKKIINGSKIRAGHVLIGLQSNGLQSNGFSLVRKVFGEDRATLEAVDPELGYPLADEVLRPNRIYVKPVLQVIKEFDGNIHGLSNITGGGWIENIPRMLPAGLRAIVEWTAAPQMPIFQLLQKRGNISNQDMVETFNCGVGMVVCVPVDQAEAIILRFNELGETAFRFGQIVQGEKGVDVLW